MTTTRFDPARHLVSKEVQAELITEALATGDTKFIVHAIRTVVRAHELATLTKDSNDTLESLFHTLNADGDGDPRLSTITKVLSALGIELKAEFKT